MSFFSPVVANVPRGTRTRRTPQSGSPRNPTDASTRGVRRFAVHTPGDLDGDELPELLVTVADATGDGGDFATVSLRYSAMGGQSDVIQPPL